MTTQIAPTTTDRAQPQDPARVKLAPVLAIVNRKGGSGKSTSVHGLAGIWGSWGIRTCLLDLDTAPNLTDFCGYPTELRATAGDWLLGNTFQPWLIPTMPNCGLLPSGPQYRHARDRFDEKTVRREEQLAKLLAPLRRDWDLILIDTKPDIDLLLTNAITAATHVLAASLCLPQYVYNCERSFNIVDDLRDNDFDISLLGFLPLAFNMHGVRPGALGLLLEMAKERHLICYPPVPWTDHAGKETEIHTPIPLAYPWTPVAKRYRVAAALIGETLGLAVPADQLRLAQQEYQRFLAEVEQ